MPALAFAARFVAVILLAAIAGFFYAYWCSVMIGLDAAGAQTALPAMQAINRMVRNAMFAPAFFGPLIALPLAAALSWRAGADHSARLLAAALAVYGVGAFGVTVSANVPLNADLARVAADAPDLEARWRHYLAYWSDWNALRAAASFLALAFAALALGHRSCPSCPRAQAPYLPPHDSAS